MKQVFIILFFLSLLSGSLFAQKKDSAQSKAQSAKTQAKKKESAKPEVKNAKSTEKKPVASPAKKDNKSKKDTIQPKTAPVVKKKSNAAQQKKDTLTTKAAKRDTAAQNITKSKPKLPIKKSVHKDSLSHAPALSRSASVADTAKKMMSVTDSLKKDSLSSILYKNFNTTRKILENHPYFAILTTPTLSPYSKRYTTPGKEIYFYTLAGLMLLFAGFKTAFSKYFNDLITLFFKRTLKQRQLQQQLIQNKLPSFLFNILFVLVAGFYLALMVQQLSTIRLRYPFWQLFSFAVALVTTVYICKYFLLKLFGWLFHIQSFTDAYIFLIFLVNKIIILFLMPVIIIASLGGTGLKTIIWTLSCLVIAALFLYRFIVAVQLVRKNAGIGVFHFLIYFIAFELLPAFVIYRVILLFLSQNNVPLHPI